MCIRSNEGGDKYGIRERQKKIDLITARISNSYVGALVSQGTPVV